MHDINTIAYELMWSDIKEEDSFPACKPLLAHYTSIDTLEKILINNEFWLSNPLFMNDFEELQYGMNLGRKMLALNEGLINSFSNRANYLKFISVFQNLFDQYDAKHVLDTYLICFSEHSPSDKDGRLSMWRGYGNNGRGAALILDSQNINEIPESPLIISRVDYMSQVEREAWVQEKIQILCQLIPRIENDENSLFTVAQNFLERLKIFSLTTKHTGFSEEKEWRLIYMSDRDTDNKLKGAFSYVINESGVEPKMKLRVIPTEGVIGQVQSIDDLIKNIILGPSGSSIISNRSFIRMLENIGKPELIERVISSSIPFRN